jgi:hypothetical protein
MSILLCKRPGFVFGDGVQAATAATPGFAKSYIGSIDFLMPEKTHIHPFATGGKGRMSQRSAVS